MGREKTILLGFLGLLAGVFVGSLSLKLLVARPPAGAGPDIRAEFADLAPQERVEPPAPTPGGWDFAAAPPLVPDAPDVTAAAPVGLAPPAPAEPPRFGRFTAPPADDAPPASAAAPPRAAPIVDEAVTPAAWQRTVPAVEPPAAALRDAPIAGFYVVRDGDSWWDVAERAYGDGRLYRALFAWNRTRDPRVTLAPGTRLDVPPLERLQAAWPRLAAPR